ncbi:MAG: LysM domain protein [Myxococcaceae bacterium]|nr:LysM domain protein [Myxococcaceae bacterium]
MKKKTMTMRHPLFASVAFLALSAGPALAQNETEMKPAEEAEQPTPAKPTKGSPSSHTVDKGDTLWDLSQKYLGSPWYWPKVWSYNPEIANPHWIYPGNQVRFLPTGEEVPTQVEVGEGPEEVEPAQMIEEDKVQVSGQIGYQGKGAVSVRVEGFVTDQEIEEAGVISGSYGETEMLSFPQQLYVSFKKAGAVKMGEPYVIYRTTTKLSHPSGGSFGYLTHVIGTAKVVRWSDKEKVATLEIVGDWEEMMRGDLVGPAGESMIRMVTIRPNSKKVEGGVVVSGGRYWFSTFGEHEQLLIDKGSADGVERGNVFTIFRQMDGTTSGDAIKEPNRLDEKWPKEDVGQCMAVEVKTKATTCLMIRSIREIMAGDHLEMRVGSGAGAASASR